MIDFVQPSKKEIERIARDNTVEISIIEEIIELWIDQISWSQWIDSRYFYTNPQGRLQDLKEIERFLIENKSDIESGNSMIIKKVVFIPFNTSKQNLNLSSYYSNIIFKRFLKEFKEDTEQFSLEIKAEKLQKKSKPGKQEKLEISERNELIINAYKHLRQSNITAYSPVIKDLLIVMEIDKQITENNIRQIINRS